MLVREIACTLTTDAGMFGLWQPEAFTTVDSLETWEDQVNDDQSLLSRVHAGTFVPVNINADGTFRFVARIGHDQSDLLDDRDHRYRTVTSQPPYLLHSQGIVCSGEIEAIGTYTGAPAVEIALEQGRYTVTVHMMEWYAEPGAELADEQPAAHALPDFLIKVKPTTDAGPYRTLLDTFDRPER